MYIMFIQLYILYLILYFNISYFFILIEMIISVYQYIWRLYISFHLNHFNSVIYFLFSFLFFFFSVVRMYLFISYL